MAEEKTVLEVRWQDEEKKPPPPSGKNIRVICIGGPVGADRELLRKCIPSAAHKINNSPSTGEIKISVRVDIMTKIIDLLKNGSVICPMEELKDFARALRVLAVHQFNVDRRESKVAVKIAHICPEKTESTIRLRADNTVKEANRDILVERSGYFEKLLKNEYRDTVDVPEVEYEHLCWVVETTHANSVGVKTWTKDAQPSQFEDFCGILEVFNIRKGCRQPVSARDTAMPSQSESYGAFSAEAGPSRKPITSPRPRRMSGITISEKDVHLLRSGYSLIPGLSSGSIPSLSRRGVGSSVFQMVSARDTAMPSQSESYGAFSAEAGPSRKPITSPRPELSQVAGHYPEAESSPKPRRMTGITISEKDEHLLRSRDAIKSGVLPGLFTSSSGRDVGSSSSQRVSARDTAMPSQSESYGAFSAEAGPSRKPITSPRPELSQVAGHYPEAESSPKPRRMTGITISEKDEHLLRSRDAIKSGVLPGLFTSSSGRDVGSSSSQRVSARDTAMPSQSESYGAFSAEAGPSRKPITSPRPELSQVAGHYPEAESSPKPRRMTGITISEKDEHLLRSRDAIKSGVLPGLFTSSSGRDVGSSSSQRVSARDTAMPSQSESYGAFSAEAGPSRKPITSPRPELSQVAGHYPEAESSPKPRRMTGITISEKDEHLLRSRDAIKSGVLPGLFTSSSGRDVGSSSSQRVSARDTAMPSQSESYGAFSAEAGPSRKPITSPRPELSQVAGHYPEAESSPKPRRMTGITISEKDEHLLRSRDAIKSGVLPGLFTSSSGRDVGSSSSQRVSARDTAMPSQSESYGAFSAEAGPSRKPITSPRPELSQVAGHYPEAESSPKPRRMTGITISEKDEHLLRSRDAIKSGVLPGLFTSSSGRDVGSSSSQRVSQRDTSMPLQSESCADFSTEAGPSRKPRTSPRPELSQVAGHYPEAESPRKPRRMTGLTISEKDEHLLKSGFSQTPAFSSGPVPSSSGRDVGSSSSQRVSKSITDKSIVTRGEADYSPRAGTSQEHGTTPRVRSSRLAELPPVPLFPSKQEMVSASNDQQETRMPLVDKCSTKAGTQDKAEPSSVKDLSAKSADQSQESASSSPNSVGSSPKSSSPSPEKD